MCECSIKKSNWGKHLKTREHGIACGEIVVEEVEKNNVGNSGGIRDLKCLGERMLHAMDALL